MRVRFRVCMREKQHALTETKRKRLLIACAYRLHGVSDQIGQFTILSTELLVLLFIAYPLHSISKTSNHSCTQLYPLPNSVAALFGMWMRGINHRVMVYLSLHLFTRAAALAVCHPSFTPRSTNLSNFMHSQPCLPVLDEYDRCCLSAQLNLPTNRILRRFSPSEGNRGLWREYLVLILNSHIVCDNNPFSTYSTELNSLKSTLNRLS